MELVRKEEPVKRVDGGILGRSIASIVLGGTAAAYDLCAILLVFIYILFAETGSIIIYRGYDNLYLFYIILYAILALVCAIIGKVLAGQAQERLGHYQFKPTKIGAILSNISLIIGILSLVAGFVANSVLSVLF